MRRLLIAALVIFMTSPLISPRAQTVISLDSLSSPRLAALERELQAGNRSALESFWREVAEKGSPLIEPVKESKQYVLAAFALLPRSGLARRPFLLRAFALERRHLFAGVQPPLPRRATGQGLLRALPGIQRRAPRGQLARLCGGRLNRAHRETAKIRKRDNRSCV